MQKITARPRKNPAASVKYKYATTYTFIKRLYKKYKRISIKTSVKCRNNYSQRRFCAVTKSVCGGNGFD